MSSILTLTEQTIRTFVGEQNFHKGQQGVREGAIVNPEQQAMALKASCYGSLPEPFRVQVTFDGSVSLLPTVPVQQAHRLASVGL